MGFIMDEAVFQFYLLRCNFTLRGYDFFYFILFMVLQMRTVIAICATCGITLWTIFSMIRYPVML